MAIQHHGVGVRRWAAIGALALGLGMMSTQSAHAQASATASATATKEMHGDWAVTCADRTQGQQRAKACVVSQTQVDPKTQQRVVTLELAPPTASGGETAATLLMPFGLVLDRGVAVQIDNAPSGAPARFQTCLPVGCVVQLRLDAKTLSMLRSGSNIKFIAIAATDGRRMLFTVPLQGLGPAVDRAVSLAKT
ncbi:invasion associated locus B family protein [Robbsia sp. KACC 23696]|uniref:invasion associated locus B family protein n=1 Tax=Robbsia sp. KACC 23696 TaxID=3149231 RepID=UPI00325AA4A2